MDFKLRSGTLKDFSHQSPHLALHEVDDHAAHAAVGIVNVLGDLHAAVLPDGQDAVVVEQGLGSRFLLRLDEIPEEDGVALLGGQGFCRLGVLDGNLAFNGGKDADIRLCRNQECRGGDGQPDRSGG
jgi:hypothetical protein